MSGPRGVEHRVISQSDQEAIESQRKLIHKTLRQGKVSLQEVDFFFFCQNMSIKRLHYYITDLLHSVVCAFQQLINGLETEALRNGLGFGKDQ